VTGRARSAGFTLIELAVAVAVIGLLLGGLLVPLATQFQARRSADAEAHLALAREALVGFAISQAAARLPCPDTDDDGVAEPPPCDDTEGWLPHVTLGLPAQDPWGRRLRYIADNNYTAAAGVPNPPATAGTLEVRDRDGNALTPVLGSTNGAAAVVFSCGANGIPDLENDGDGVTPNADADCSNPGAPVNSVYTEGVITEDVFDDQLVWLSKHSLVSRLVRSGRWPP